ncbi:MFS transporter [Rugosimonospora acidiphila]|uniref:MFS transporter n=1 Tax=Rugosimonospora acidiphila TaxID=556531 RepID=A0ABP9RQM0_9ACTN
MLIADNRTVTGARTPRVSRRAGFWIFGAALFGLLAASGAPSPLYVVYQQRFGFSATTLTAVFAVYALALLLALVTVGGLSDYIGRRPVLAASLFLDAVSMVIFLTADGVGELLLARVLQGIATGAATGAIGAGLVDLAPPGHPHRAAVVNSTAPTAGLAVGALLAGALVQYAPAPTTLTFALLAAGLAALTIAILIMPEVAGRRPGALRSLRPRVGIPAAVRRRFFAAAPVLVATWAVGGLYLSLGPSIAAGVLHLHSHLLSGLLLFALTAAGSLTSFLLRDRPAERVMAAGCAALIVGTALSLVALALHSTPLFFAGTVIAGIGFGAGFVGAFRSLVPLAAPSERAGLIAAVYVVSYLAFSVPAVIAGLLVGPLGLLGTAVAYGTVVIALALAVLPASLRRAARGGITAAPASR